MCQSEYALLLYICYNYVDHVFQPSTYLKEIINFLYLLLLLSCVAWYHQRDIVFIHLPIVAEQNRLD